jgi:hypothetical protein
MGDKRNKTFIFTQYLKADYWDWPNEKKEWFDNWKQNKSLIFDEVYHRVKELETDNVKAKVALIVHDKDRISVSDDFKDAHLHGYIEFSAQRPLGVLATHLGLLPQYIETTKQGYGRLNSKAYLIHAKSPEKYQYLPTEVETFGTFDYQAFISENIEDFKKYNATSKRKKSEIGLDLILQQVQVGKLKYLEIMQNDDYAFLYANNQRDFREAFSFYGERTAFLRLQDLRKQAYHMTILYIQGASGVGKSTLAREIAKEVRRYGQANEFDSDIYSGSSKNTFDDYFGEDILLLDDLRPDSILPSDWLKVLDPLNEAKMSARFKNRLIVPRMVILVNYQSPENFFSKLNGEDLDQFIRRINYCIKLSEKRKIKFYQLSQSEKLTKPKFYQTSESNVTNLNYGMRELLLENDKEEFMNKLLPNYIFPRIFPQKKSPTSK